MTTSIRLKQSTAWVALLALASASAGGNRNATDERTEKVNYEDLNVDTLAGASILYDRIERAARAVCGAEQVDRESPMDKSSCYRTAIAAAVAKVNSPWLTAIHGTKTGGLKLAALRNPRSRVE
jgi:UrcA family protein